MAQKLPRISASRSQVVRGDKSLDWLFKNKRQIRPTKPFQILSASFAIETPSEHPGLVFLFQVTKRDIPEAHDRQKVKRWLREAIRRSEDLQVIALNARKKLSRTHLALRIKEKPGPKVNWPAILADVELAGSALRVQLKSKEPQKLVKKVRTVEVIAEESSDA